jgi:hypothetical protein
MVLELTFGIVVPAIVLVVYFSVVLAVRVSGDVAGRELAFHVNVVSQSVRHGVVATFLGAIATVAYVSAKIRCFHVVWKISKMKQFNRR